jgi:hypothetical protein
MGTQFLRRVNFHRFASRRLPRALPIFAILCILPSGALAEFSLPSFPSAAGLNLVDDATVTSNVLRLTPSAASQLGAAWHQTQQDVQNPFEANFQFRITDQSTPSTFVDEGADGFAFVIQNQSALAIGGTIGGSSLGYHGISNSIAVEFDTFDVGPADSIGDPNNNHLSVHTHGTQPNFAHEFFSLGNTGTSLATDLSDGAVHDVRILYLPGTLRIYLDGSGSPALAAPLNIASTLNLPSGTAWVGFTSATGNGYETHDILSWSFRAIPEPSALMLAVAACAGLAGVRRRR